MAKKSGPFWPWVLGALGAGVAGWWFFLRKKPVAEVIEDTLGSDVQARVAAAIATEDPEKMRELAAELAREGYDGAASDLEVVARQAEASAENEIDLVQLARTLPSAIVDEVERIQDAVASGNTGSSEAEPSGPDLRELALALAQHIRGTTKGREDKARVRRYQTAAGLNADGLYGMQTALSLHENGVSMPPDPLYWSSWSQVNAWKEWKKEKAA